MLAVQLFLHYIMIYTAATTVTIAFVLAHVHVHVIVLNFVLGQVDAYGFPVVIVIANIDRFLAV